VSSNDEIVFPPDSINGVGAIIGTSPVATHYADRDRSLVFITAARCILAFCSAFVPAPALRAMFFSHSGAQSSSRR